MKFFKRNLFQVIFVAAAFIISAATALTGGQAGRGYDLEVGGIAPRRIQSPDDMVNEIATGNLREAAAAAARANPIFRQDSDITLEALYTLGAFFEQIEEMRRLHNPLFDPTMPDREGLPVEDMDRWTLNPQLPYEEYFIFVVTTPGEVYVAFRDSVMTMAEGRMSAGIREDTLHSVFLSLREELDGIYEWDEVVRSAAFAIISQVLAANVFEDIESMELAAQAAMDAVEPVIIRRGQNIVLDGAVITRDIYDLLDSLGLLRTSPGELIQPMIGALLAVAAVFIVGLSFVSAAYGRLFTDRKNVVLLFTLYVLTIAIAWLLQEMNFILVPILIFTMLASVLLDEKLAVGFCLCVSVICAVIVMGDVRFVAFFTLTGLFVAITARLITERSKMLSVTALISGFCFLSVCAVYLIADGAVSMEMWDTAVMAALYGIFSVVLCVGVLPFFESAFGFVTAIKIVDLANPNNPLLKRLIIEAPGTYQHSLVVANLAETACYSIGANHALARIGGYYHDVGKINFPHYFIENITDGVNPHDSMDPMISAKILNEHVSNGLALADAYKLPKPVRAFIEEHHGGAVMSFFYHKAKEAAKEEPDGVESDVLEDFFRYKQRIPQSRESAVVMLADNVEAAVRAYMQSRRTMDDLPVYIDKLIRERFMEGRLQDSGLIIKDLTTIAEAFMRVFRGMFHERVAYPTTAAPAADAPLLKIRKNKRRES